MNARQVPADHLLPLTCDAVETISEKDYKTTVVPQLRKTLKERKLLGEDGGLQGIKCLVTTFDVPLKVGAHEPTVVERGEIAEYEKTLGEIAEDLTAQIAKIESVARSAGSGPDRPAAASATAPASTTVAASSTAPGTGTAPAAKPTWREVVPKVEAAGRAAGERILKLPVEERAGAMRQFILLQEHIGGTAALLRSASVPANASTAQADAARRQLAAMTADVQAVRDQIAALMPQRDSARMRREIVAQRLKIEGVVGQAVALEEMIRYVRPEQTGSSFDNELMLLTVDQSYSREGWINNPMCLDAYVSRRGAAKGNVPKVVMVSRLDGSSVAKVQEMIDTTLAVEAKGLEGKMYIDARGLYGTDGYSNFDTELRRTAAWMKAHSSMETVLEDTGELLKAADAPEAAVYCGWYSLRNYQESGQWVKGAVGYHVASYEMMTLHNPAENGWVVNLLNRGFCGTLGPTDEPYLHSFPKPSQFFPLMLSGDFTQGEVWLLTVPLVSWRQGLVGDPLYNPFKKMPRVKREDLKADGVLRGAYEEMGR
jgi:uncharacterized protein (TIGR03790 family)